MRFELHPDAVAAFTSQTDELLSAVKVDQSLPSSREADYKPEVHVGFHLNREHLRGPIEMFQSDQHGQRVSRFIEDQAGVTGFDEIGYARLLKVAESIQKTSSFR